MNTYFNYNQTYNKITLEFCNSVKLSEREIHPYHEILYLEDTSVTLFTENNQSKLSGNQLLVIPKGKYHWFDLSGVKHFTRLKISIPDNLLDALPVRLFGGGICTVFSKSPTCDLLVKRIMKLLQGERDERTAFHAYSAAMLLLAELDASELKEDPSAPADNAILSRVTAHISENLSGDLSIDALAKLSNASVSFLSHTFQKKMGISLHRYIVQKRLILAKEKIAGGEKPSKIYRECGFGDYSSFYKAYLRYFSSPPSADER